jgi:hypothetical protein
MVFQICSIFSNILSGLAYLFTSNPNNLPKIGNKNIVNTVIITPIIAYLIVLIAGLILSSLPPERINNKPHHSINTIESIHANKTKRDIDSNIKSQNVIVSANSGLLVAVVAAVFNAYVVLIIINLLLI